MAIAKRGSRLINVDGIEYRWKVRRMAAFGPEGPLSTETVIVEAALGSRRPLKVALPTLPTDEWLHGPGLVVLPRQVASWIREAVASGWSATTAGPIFLLSPTIASATDPPI